MSNSDDDRKAEIERLRQALDEETQRCLEVQRQLDRANADFEEFISMTAHDLREPLRDVASFSQLIAETSGGSLNSEAGAYLERIQAGAARMQSLLADVVGYWTTAGTVRPASRTDMEAALRQALLLTEKQAAERNAVVTHGPLPAVLGDSESLTRVLHHLIKNAIEYCEAPVPRIHVSSRLADSECVFSVQDNGPGIDRAFQDRIFGAFKRLHGREFPGHGLGLSFCKRAIEGHGGRLSVESTPGAGATFSFTLPLAD